MVNVAINDPSIVLLELPEALSCYPGIISRHERQLLYSLSRECYKGRGQIIDIGAFLGASTAAFSAGLQDGDRKKYWKGPGKPIVSFKRAQVESYYQKHAQKYKLPDLAPGTSFEQVLKKFMSGYIDNIDLKSNDIIDYDGSKLENIEICFFGNLKSLPVTQHSIQIIFPHLLIGSHIIVKNYFFHDMPFIKVNIEAFSEYFSYIGEVDSSAIFRLEQNLNDRIVEEQLKPRSLSEQLRLHLSAEQRSEDLTRQYYMQLSKCLLIASTGDKARARAVLQEANDMFPTIAFNLDGTYRENIAGRISKLEKNINRYTQETPSNSKHRSTICSIPQENLKTIQKGAMNYHWRDVLCNKDPFDLALYPLLLWREKPKTIIEIGTKEGGSALWLVDLCRLFDLDTQIISIDIDQRTQFSHPNIHFYQGDGRNLSATLNKEFIAQIRHPLIVIEDADHHYLTTKAVLEFFSPILEIGEYIIIEDGICDSLGHQGRYDGGPTRAIAEFLNTNQESFVIDEWYCDYFGFNVTWNTNGYLKKTSD